MIYVIATATVKEGCLEKYKALARGIYDKVRAEKGCIFYVLTEDAPTDLPSVKAPEKLTMVECWESNEALKAHLASDHMKAFAAAVKELRIGSELRVVTPV